MASVQIKNVPDDVRAELHRRADASGKSLQEYLLHHLITEARSVPLEEVLARAGSHRGGVAPAERVVQILHEDRDRR